MAVKHGATLPDLGVTRLVGDQQSAGAVSAASALAQALDRDDFVAAEGFLAADCLYESPEGAIEGPAAIITAYRKNAEWAARTFDKIVYASEVEPEGADAARITYIDRIMHRGQSHEYRCRQIVAVNADGLVVHIRHEDIAGARTDLLAYFDRIGVKNDS